MTTPSAGPAAASLLDTRHALGLPAGSVRAVLVLLIVGLIWILLLLPPRDNPVEIPLYLFYLLFLILGHFFAAHGVTIAAARSGHPSPLYLPGGFIRAFIVLGFAAVIGWKIYSDPDGLFRQLEESVKSIPKQPYLPLVLLGGFFLGVLVRWLVGRRTTAYWLQDLQAYVSLLAIIGLVVEFVILLVINPTLQQPLKLPEWQGILAAIVAFYFGARS
jgi:hypothetical protein